MQCNVAQTTASRHALLRYSAATHLGQRQIGQACLKQHTVTQPHRDNSTVRDLLQDLHSRHTLSTQCSCTAVAEPRLAQKRTRGTCTRYLHGVYAASALYAQQLLHTHDRLHREGCQRQRHTSSTAFTHSASASSRSAGAWPAGDRMSRSACRCERGSAALPAVLLLTHATCTVAAAWYPGASHLKTHWNGAASRLLSALAVPHVRRIICNCC